MHIPSFELQNQVLPFQFYSFPWLFLSFVNLFTVYFFIILFYFIKSSVQFDFDFQSMRKIFLFLKLAFITQMKF